MPKYPDVMVKLTGTDGNAFAIIGAVQREIQREVSREAASQWVTDAMASESYDALLSLAMRTVHVR